MIIDTDILRLTVAHFNITTEALRGPTRGPAVVTARHVAWYLERKQGTRSYHEIAAIYNRDHSSIVVGFKHVTERLAAGDARYAPAVHAIEAALARESEERRVAQKVVPLLACPTCGAGVVELQRQLADIHRRLTELGVKP